MKSMRLRTGTPHDAAPLGAICYQAFKTISEAHGFPPDFPSAEIATGLLSHLLSHPGFYSVVAEHEGRVVGSNFLDERSMIAGVGPITVDPAAQNQGIGRRLMQGVLDRGQGGFHVHMHHWPGRPVLSRMDAEEIPKVVTGLRRVGVANAHGIVLLHDVECAAWVCSATPDVTAAWRSP